MENVLEIKGLKKVYSDFTLNKVNINLPLGRIMGIIGKNGSGKTTIIKSIINLIKGDEGEILVFGKNNIEYETEIKRNVSVVLDQLYFSIEFNAIQLKNVLSGMIDNFDPYLYMKYIEKFQIPKNKPIKTYSTGMKVKLNIAQALAKKPKLLILDEPTNSLDPVSREEILEILLDFVHDEKNSILISSHITSDLEKMCDYITIIDNGKIYMCEEKDILLEKYGICRCGENDLKKIDKKYISGYRKSEISNQVLINNRINFNNEYKNLSAEKTTLEEIVIYFLKNNINE